MQERHDDGAAIHDDLLAARPGLDQAHLARGAPVEPSEDKTEENEKGDDGDDDDDDDAECSKFHGGPFNS